MSPIRSFVGGLVAVAALAGSANAALVLPGTYELSNHPDGSATPPPYGLRLDELYNATSSHDIFTFNFDAPQSSVFMVITANSIRITGQALGGRDTGGAHANDAYLGVYTFDFLYSTGVQPAAGDDDLIVNAANRANSGTIVTPLGDTIALVDERSGGFSFRFGDEDNDAGHRGFAGLSGWGWLTHGGSGATHVAASDWLFTAELVEIPTPGALALTGLAGLAMLRRRAR